MTHGRECGVEGVVGVAGWAVGRREGLVLNDVEEEVDEDEQGDALLEPSRLDYSQNWLLWTTGAWTGMAVTKNRK